MIVEHNLPRPYGLIECETVLDVGAGVRPMNWYKPTRHICVEPCEQYAKHLTEAGYEVIGKTALEALRTKRKGHAVYMLDVIEHMEKDDALEVADFLYEIYAEVIGMGAVARLHTHARATYADPARAGDYRAIFESKLNEAADKGVAGHSKPRHRVAIDEIV